MRVARDQHHVRGELGGLGRCADLRELGLCRSRRRGQWHFKRVVRRVHTSSGGVRGAAAAATLWRLSSSPESGSSTRRAASVRDETPSLRKLDARWLFTVLSERKRRAAISPLVSPARTSSSTCFSR